jgi:diguanylate cyclase (GGDEF)-like protein
MAVDINKQLERAKRFLERNRIEDAVDSYQVLLNEVPGQVDALQALGDAYTHLGQLDRSTYYYGLLFDRFFEMREELKAAAIYTRTLKGVQQPAERISRYAMLLQKQNRVAEAIEQFTQASELYLAHGHQESALECLERLALLDPENPRRQTSVAVLAEQQGKINVATRGFLRAGQLAEAAGDSDAALELLARAHQISPEERSPALFYAQALLSRGDATTAAQVLEPFSGELDSRFLETLGDALLRSGAFDRARDILLRLPAEYAGGPPKLFELASCYLAGGQDSEGIELLRRVQGQMVAARQESNFTTRLDALVESFPASIPLAEFWAAAYAALSRETKYFEALVRLFDLYLGAENASAACEALEKIVEIDPYDSRNQQRIEQLGSHVDPVSLARIRSRLSQVATHSGQTPEAHEEAPASRPENSAGSSQQTLEDLIVQAEIFVQYSLQAKAIERLQKIAVLFPGEPERNERLRNLCRLANWWPEGSPGDPARAAAPPVNAPAENTRESRDHSADSMRDLAKISEISQSFLRLASPRAILSAAVNGVGKYLRVTRCLAVIGAPDKAPQMASEFCAPGTESAPSALLVRLLAQLERAEPDALGGVSLDAAAAPLMRELGLETTIGVILSDRETQTQGGMIVAGSSGPRTWRPNETYFLQAVGNQMLFGVNHLRLRTMTRTLGAADEKTGLLARSAYQDCLLHETRSAKSKGTALSLALLQIDGGAELMRQHGEAQLEGLLEQLARALGAESRQDDIAVKYTSWTIAFILPDTPLAGAQEFAEKLRRTGAQVQPQWKEPGLTLSASVAEALVRQEYESEDIVTELINRAATGLEDAELQGGDAVVTPSVQEN